MRSSIIQAMREAGISEAKSTLYWQSFLEDVCDGEEPTEKGLSLLKDEQIERAMKPLAAAAILGAIRGPRVDKPKRYKSGRATTAAEYAAAYEREPTNPDLLADIARVTADESRLPRSWVIAPAGKFNATESARYLQWHMNGDDAPPVVMVDGAPVAPVLPGEERKTEERLYYVDPFDPDAFLDVDMGSARTGAGFRGYVRNEGQADEDASPLSAMQFLWSRRLRQEGNLALNRLANEMRGKGPADILNPFPAVLAEWNANPKSRPAAKRAKARVDPFVEPTPVAAPSVGVASAAKFDVHAAHAAIIQASAAGNRDHFLGGLPAGMVASLPRASTPAAQVLSDLATLAQMNLANGTRPEQVYIENAIHLIAPRREADVLRAMLAPREPTRATIYIMGGEYERRAAQALKSHLAVYERNGKVRAVVDSDIRPGEVRDAWCAKQIATATVVVFLVSVDTINNLQPPRDKRTIPVLVRSCLWQSDLGDVRPLPRSGKPVTEDDWPDIARDIAVAIGQQQW